MRCDASQAPEGAPPVRSPLNFFVLVFALSIPFWLAGAMSDMQLMPGLSVSALMTFSPMAAALILVHREGGGAQVGVLWHLPALLLMHRSPAWIAWWCLWAVAARIFIVWIYNNTGKSVFAVALFHTMLNLSYMLFPVNGSHFDLGVAGPVMAFTAAIVISVWGPSTLARWRHS